MRNAPFAEIQFHALDSWPRPGDRTRLGPFDCSTPLFILDK